MRGERSTGKRTEGAFSGEIFPFPGEFCFGTMQERREITRIEVFFKTKERVTSYLLFLQRKLRLQRRIRSHGDSDNHAGFYDRFLRLSSIFPFQGFASLEGN